MTRKRSRSLVVLSVLAAIGFAILISLGVWQVQRLEWKEALIARVEAGLKAAPIAAPGPDVWGSLDTTEMEYTPVTLSGRFLNDHEIHVVFTLTAPKGPASGIGFMVMTPFETTDGWTAYVNRGFVPADRADPGTRSGGRIDGITTVTGLLRAPHRTAWFMPSDDVERNQWFSRDPSLFAEAAGFPPDMVAPYIVDAYFDPDLAGGLPQGGETVVSFPNSHLQYAITWFGLAAALVAVFIAFLRQDRRRED